jgi:hypothetical protein
MVQCNKEPSKWIQSEIKEKGEKAKQKVKKSKEKMREKHSTAQNSTLFVLL